MHACRAWKPGSVVHTERTSMSCHKPSTSSTGNEQNESNLQVLKHLGVCKRCERVRMHAGNAYKHGRQAAL